MFVSVRVTASLTVAAAVYLEERDAFSFTLTRQVIEDDLSTLQVNLLNALSTVSGKVYSMPIIMIISRTK